MTQNDMESEVHNDMFGFYKDLLLKMNGIEPRGLLQQEKTEKEKGVFSTKTKVIVWVMGILYLIVAAVGIYVTIVHEKEYIRLIKYVLLTLLDVVSLVFVLSKNKNRQYIAVGTIIAFIALNFVMLKL